MRLSTPRTTSHCPLSSATSAEIADGQNFTHSLLDSCVAGGDAPYALKSGWLPRTDSERPFGSSQSS